LLGPQNPAFCPYIDHFAHFCGIVYTLSSSRFSTLQGTMIPLFVAFTIFSVVVNTISFSDLPATTAGCNPSYNAEASQYVNVPHSLVADDAHVINYKSSSAVDVSVVQDAVIITDHSLTADYTDGALDKSLPLVLASQGSSSSIYQINLYWFKAFVLVDIADSVNELAVIPVPCSNHSHQLSIRS
jgi:hypothetical protein